MRHVCPPTIKDDGIGNGDSVGIIIVQFAQEGLRRGERTGRGGFRSLRSPGRGTRAKRRLYLRGVLPPTGLRFGTAATAVRSRGSMTSRAPDRSKRYWRPVTGPVTTNRVRPTYSYTVVAGVRGGIVARLAEATVHSLRLRELPLPQHIVVLLWFFYVGSRRCFTGRRCSFHQNRRTG